MLSKIFAVKGKRKKYKKQNDVGPLFEIAVIASVSSSSVLIVTKILLRLTTDVRNCECFL